MKPGKILNRLTFSLMLGASCGVGASQTIKIETELSNKEIINILRNSYQQCATLKHRFRLAKESTDLNERDLYQVMRREYLKQGIDLDAPLFKAPVWNSLVTSKTVKTYSPDSLSVYSIATSYKIADNGSCRIERKAKVKKRDLDLNGSGKDLPNYGSTARKVLTRAICDGVLFPSNQSKSTVSSKSGLDCNRTLDKSAAQLLEESKSDVKGVACQRIKLSGTDSSICVMTDYERRFEPIMKKYPPVIEVTYTSFDGSVAKEQFSRIQRSGVVPQ